MNIEDAMNKKNLTRFEGRSVGREIMTRNALKKVAMRMKFAESS